MNTYVHHLPDTVSQSQLEAALAHVCADGRVDGVLIQLPLPRHLSEEVRGRGGPGGEREGGYLDVPHEIGRHSEGIVAREGGRRAWHGGGRQDTRVWPSVRRRRGAH